MNDELKKFIEKLRTYICGAEAASYYARDLEISKYDENEHTDYLQGYKKGYNDGLEGALGLLELVEEQNDIVRYYNK